MHGTNMKTKKPTIIGLVFDSEMTVSSVCRNRLSPVSVDFLRNSEGM